MERFTYEKTAIEGVYIITPKKIIDSRGYYERYFCVEEFKEVGFTEPVKQINHSMSIQKGIVRGFHYQLPPHCEMKLVRCIKGKIFDVALDVRKDSPTFLQHVSVELSEENSKYLLLPEGVAHGFQTMTENSEIIYIVNKMYAPSVDKVVNPLDPMINVSWPVEVDMERSKEVKQTFLTKDFTGVEL
jgi:dTDP-4-dehydrorhamnose 3,5-epimerase